MKKREITAIRPDRLIWGLLFCLLVERLLVFFQLGADYNSGSDDINYIQSGIVFAKTGMITYGGDYPTALIMPGMPVIIGAVCRLVGDGPVLWVSMRLLWCVLGVLTAWYALRTAKLLSNTWGGIAAALWFVLPNMAWMNHVVLTETPYLLFLHMCLYYMFVMGRDKSRKWFFRYMISFLLALMFRANAIALPVFAAVYLLAKKHFSLNRAVVFACVCMAVLTPWTIRNYRQFHAVIPLTYGAGQPMLQGTYQGEGWPQDENLDYETNVHQVMQKVYAEYYTEQPIERNETNPYLELYDPEGEVREEKNAQYLSMLSDGVQARYRLREWWKSNPLSLLKSYLLIKPRWMLNWAWAWEEVFHVSYELLHRLSQVNLILCLLALPLLLAWKERFDLLYLTAMYIVQVYIHAMSFVTDRYASSLMGIRYVWAGIGVGIAIELWQNHWKKRTGRSAANIM